MEEVKKLEFIHLIIQSLKMDKILILLSFKENQ